MYRRVLPIFLVSVLFSCNKPAPETSSVADTISVKEEIPGDTVAVPEEEEGILEMIDVHAPVIDICGFSDDGKYFAFTQTITGEGEVGDAWVFIIDVARNEWVTKPAHVEKYNQELDLSVDLDSALTVARDAMLTKYKIGYHKYTGREFKLGTDTKVVIAGKDYNVDLKVTDLLIDLRVKGNGKDIVLQKDKKVPSSRGLVSEYRLATARTFNDKIVVFVEYDGQPQEGFEGYRYFDRKYIAVTGVVK